MVNEEKVSIVYNGNGKTKEFNYPYSFTEGAEIVGYLNNGKAVTKINSNFEFNASTKKYTYPTSGNPIPAGQSLMLIRRTQRSNLVDLPNDTPFAAIERQFDKVVRILQELGDTEGMGKTMTVLSNQFNAVIPKGKPYAYIRFNKDVTAFEVVDNPFEVGENQLQQIREVQKTIEVLQGAMNNGINHLNQIKEDFDVGVTGLNNMADSLTTQFRNILDSKLEESVNVLTTQQDNLLAGMNDVVKSGVNSINLNMQELERIKKSVIDDNLVEIRQLKDEAVERAVEARTSANEAAESAVAALASEGNASRSEINAKASETKSAVSEGNAASSAKAASTSASSAKKSAISASTSASTAIRQATAAESSAVEAKRQADRATDIAGGDLATRPEVGEQVSTALSTANKNLQTHMDSDTAHLELFNNVNKSAQKQLDSHNTSKDAHVELFKNMQSSFEATSSELDENLRQYIDDNVESLTSDITVGLNTKADKTTVEALSVKVDTKANETIVAEIDKKLETKMPIAGGTFTNNPNIKSGDFSAITLENKTGKKLILEGTPDDRPRMGTIILYDNLGKKDINRIDIPKKTGEMALLSDRTSIDGKVGNIRLWDIFHRYGENPNWVGKSNQDWVKLGFCITNFSQIGKIEQQPQQWGQLINIPYSNPNGGAECTQLWIDQSSADIRIRGANGSKELRNVGFKRLLRAEEIADRRVVINTWRSGNNWWREWSDGWVEQGGQAIVPKPSYNYPEDTTITFTRAFTGPWPYISYQLIYTATDILPNNIVISSLSLTSMKLNTSKIAGKSPVKGELQIRWEARGWK